MGDHAETLQLAFDPQQISYRELLRIFWLEHRPVQKPWSGQYRSAVFCADATQLEIAKQIRAEFEVRWDATVYTEIRIEKAFYRAEEYHQKYRLQDCDVIMEELRRCYPHFDDLVDSLAAARLNAYLGGARSKTRLASEIEGFGLSEEAKVILKKKTP